MDMNPAFCCQCVSVDLPCNLLFVDFIPREELNLTEKRKSMKSFHLPIACAIVFLLMGSATYMNAAPVTTSAGASNEVWSAFQHFVKEKHALEKRLAKKHQAETPPRVEEFFAAEQKGDWASSSNLFHAIADDLGKRNPDHKLIGIEPWGPAQDSFSTYEIIHAMHPKFVKMFGEEIVKSIPPGSIYLGGTAEGRFLVSAFSVSHSEGRPFFTITQNKLADPLYFDYVADMYGDKIYVADANDSANCVSNYTADVKVRLSHDQKYPNEPRQIRPGEDVDLDDAGKLKSNSYIGVMAINALMAKMMFDKNPTREFYVEESFPQDWMFPHLKPFGLIMKLDRGDIPELSADVLKQDHEFWSKYSDRLVGNWIAFDTSVKDVAAFVEKVYLHHDYEGFQGDPDYVRDEAAQRAFSKLRSSIAGVYAWRLGSSQSGVTLPPEYAAQGAGRKLIEREADFAFKQAWAFCPGSSEAVYRYVQLLVNVGRVDDALLIAETAKKIDPGNGNFQYLIDNLKSIKAQSDSRADVQSETARLEKAVAANPTNVTQQFELAQKYVQAGENERGYKVLDRILGFSDVTLPEVMSVADAYNKLHQPQKLATTLERLTQLAPDSPEAWYDLAAARASLGQAEPAVEALKKALDFNAKRLARDSKANDLRTNLAADARFSKLRETPEFKALIAMP
jgi:tetratricopeptide (TPR) repeat protein